MFIDYPMQIREGVEQELLGGPKCKPADRR